MKTQYEEEAKPCQRRTWPGFPRRTAFWTVMHSVDEMKGIDEQQETSLPFMSAEKARMQITSKNPD